MDSTFAQTVVSDTSMSADSLKIILNDSNYIQLNISPYSTASTLSQDISRFSKKAPVKWRIYVTARTLKRMPLSSSVLKLVTPEENIADLINKLDELNIPHVFYAFPERGEIGSVPLDEKAFGRDLLGDGKWKKVGSLCAKLEKGGAEKPFADCVFYLEENFLCYHNKECKPFHNSRSSRNEQDRIEVNTSVRG